MTEALAAAGGPTDSIADVFLSQGLMGAIAVALVYYIMMQRAELRDLRSVHKTEIAAKDSLIHDLQEERLREVKSMLDVVNSYKATMEALLAAVRKGT